MDFNLIELSEDQSKVAQVSKQENLDRILAKHTKALSIDLKRAGGKLISRPQVGRVAVHPVTQTDYNCRKFALLHLIRNPQLTDARYPLANSWKSLYPHIPYNERATNWGLSKTDRQEIKDVMKAEGVWKHVELTRVRHIIDRVHTYYMENKVITLEKRIKVLELQLADNGNVWYRGIEIVKLARTFKVTVQGVTIETRHGTFDKLFEFLGQVDDRLAGDV